MLAQRDDLRAPSGKRAHDRATAAEIGAVADADESLLYSLTGWAEPVYGAQLSDELMATLAAC